MEERDKLQELLQRLKEREQSGPVKVLKSIEQAITGRDPNQPSPTQINGEEDMPVPRGMGGRPRIRQGEDMAPMPSDPISDEEEMEKARLMDAEQTKRDALEQLAASDDDGYSRMGGSEARVEDPGTGRKKARRMRSDY